MGVSVLAGTTSMCDLTTIPVSQLFDEGCDALQSYRIHLSSAHIVFEKDIEYIHMANYGRQTHVLDIECRMSVE